MGSIARIIAGLAAIATLTVGAVPAQADAAHDAEQLRKLDIMLMVTALRCRHGSDNFQSDYEKFSARHHTALQSAAQSMQAGMVRRYGTKGAKRQLDKISVGMANRYGQGHPWLGCAQLKQVTRDLASNRDSGRLLAAADQLLANNRPAQFAMAN